MNRESVKKGGWIETPWVARDGKPIKLSKADAGLLKLLPERDVLAGTRHASCAVVGSGGNLLTKKWGAEIDAHDAVFRFNLAPTIGFEEYVGSKTTYRMINRKHFGFRESDAEIGLQHTTTPDVITSFWQYKRLFPHLTIYSLDMSFYRHIMTEKDTGSSRPSNGYLGMHLALMVCDKVEVYGFMRNWKAAKTKYHYFNDEEPNASQSQRDGKGELPQIERLIKVSKGRIKMAHT